VAGLLWLLILRLFLGAWSFGFPKQIRMRPPTGEKSRRRRMPGAIISGSIEHGEGQARKA
jgi:hypothetical protein